MKRNVASKVLVIASLLLFAVVPIQSLLGQVQAGRIVGTVSDPNKAVVPNAKVVITNTGTNQVQNLLPTGLFPPTLRKSNPEDSPILWLAVTTDDTTVKPIDIMIFTRNVLFDQFAILPGVG